MSDTNEEWEKATRPNLLSHICVGPKSNIGLTTIQSCVWQENIPYWKYSGLIAKLVRKMKMKMKNCDWLREGDQLCVWVGDSTEVH